jgi:Phosphotransferase enzyme family
MRSEATKSLAYDAVLPQRDFLLDVGQVARLLSTRIGVDGPVQIRECELLRIKYRFGESLRVLYRINVDGSSHLVAARTFGAESSEDAWQLAESSAVGCGQLCPVLRDGSIDTVFWTFPNDRKIANLHVLTNVPCAIPGLLGSNWTQSRVVAYAPEKCATAECLNRRLNTLAYAKVYADDSGRRCAQVHQSLWRNIAASKSSLRIPHVVAYSENCRTLLVEAMRGKPIASLPATEWNEGLRRLGAALAWLHSLPLADDLPRFKRVDVDRLREAARIIGLVRPDVAGLAHQLSEHLCSRREEQRQPDVCLHGDVHPKNGIAHDHGFALIDLDQASTGPAAADLGSLLAALHYNRLTGQLSASAEAEWAGAFLSGYQAVRELPESSAVLWHTAAALLAERALRAVNRIRPDGLQHLAAVLSAAERLLAERNYD